MLFINLHLLSLALMFVYDVVLQISKWIIDNGQFVNFWNDAWLFFIFFMYQHLDIPKTFKFQFRSKVYYSWNGIGWHIPSSLSNIEDIGNINIIVIIDKIDETIWIMDESSLLNMKTTHTLIHTNSISHSWGKIIHTIS